MKTQVIVLALTLLLTACGGGSGGSYSVTNPVPDPSITLTATFNVVQADATTPAANVPIYVNRQSCSSNCDVTLTTNAQGTASMTMTAFTGYCISLHNGNVSPATVPSTPTYVVGTGAQPYLQSDECVETGDLAVTFYLAE